MKTVPGPRCLRRRRACSARTCPRREARETTARLGPAGSTARPPRPAASARSPFEVLEPRCPARLEKVASVMTLPIGRRSRRDSAAVRAPPFRRRAPETSQGADVRRPRTGWARRARRPPRCTRSSSPLATRARQARSTWPSRARAARRREAAAVEAGRIAEDERARRPRERLHHLRRNARLELFLVG